MLPLLVMGISWNVVTAALRFPTTSMPPYELKAYLGKHQNASKALRKNGTFYSYYRSYPWDLGFGGNSSCAFANLTDQCGDGSMVFDMGYYNATAGKLFYRPTYVSVNHTTNYSVNNEFIVRESPGGFPFNFTIVFSDYEACNILRAPHYGGGCDLNVHESYINKPLPDCCEFVYELLCGPQKYYIYNETICRNVQDKLLVTLPPFPPKPKPTTPAAPTQ
ncbi:uncharacterized protein LOC144169141 [Haemaphysalis longicornis]